MNEINIFVAFLAGIASFISPCVLPLLPAYINILTSGEKGRDIILKKSLIFILGFTLIFIIMGASFSFLGKLFNENIRILRIVSGFLIIIFGLHTLDIIKFKSFYKEKRLMHKVDGAKPFLMGMAFAFGWTPCIGPILGSILLYTSTSESGINGMLMLAFYSLGLGVPFVITGMLIDKFNSYKGRLYSFMKYIKIISGVIMILVGVLIMTNKLVIFIGLIS